MTISFRFTPNTVELKKTLQGSDAFKTIIAIQNITSQFETAAKMTGHPVSCKKGCSHCCKSSAIIITGTEAAIIAKYTNREIRKLYGDKRSLTGLPCSFLSHNGTCTIYNFRPSTCRALISFDDPFKCRDEILREAFSTDHVFPAIINSITPQEQKLLNSQLGQNIDIREAFPPI